MIAASEGCKWYDEGAQQQSGIIEPMKLSDKPSLGDTRPPSLEVEVAGEEMSGHDGLWVLFALTVEACFYPLFTPVH